VLPVLIEAADLPSQLIGRLYVDATGSLASARVPLRKALSEIIGTDKLSTVEAVTAARTVWISSVQFTLFEDTVRQYGGPFAEYHTATEVREEALKLLATLRRKANGILLNFISARSLDWSDPRFKFPNGQVSERIEDIAGPFDGTIRNRAVVDVEVINPNEERLTKLVSSQLEALGVLRVTYQFSLSPPDEDLSARALEKLQETYSILSWDAATGAEVALPDDVRLTVRTTSEEISIAIETRYPFQLERRAKEFSVRDFVEWLRT
jgi:hypothetical protein